MSAIATDPTLDFVGLFADQDEATILGRLQGWANEGLDPVDDAEWWVDTREGGHWQTVLMPAVREFARLYDLAGTEVPMSGFVLWAWGTYLDDLASVWDVHRLAGTQSQGTEMFVGPVGTEIAAGTRLTVNPSTPDDPAPEFEVTSGGTIGGSGTLSLAIQAVEPGFAGDVGANAITAPSTPLPGVTFNNPDPTIGGSDPESDDALRDRVIKALLGKGPGNVADYVRWASAQPGVGMVWVVPVFNGPGTVLVTVADANGAPLPAGPVSSLQTELDPVAGKGSGVAPVGAAVTVATSTLLNVVIVADLVYETGYSADGSVGTSVAPGIAAVVQPYLTTVQPGDELIYERIRGLVATTPGVKDIVSLTVNGGTANITTTVTPPQIPTLQTLTLS